MNQPRPAAPPSRKVGRGGVFLVGGGPTAKTPRTPRRRRELFHFQILSSSLASLASWRLALPLKFLEPRRGWRRAPASGPGRPRPGRGGGRRRRRPRAKASTIAAYWSRPSKVSSRAESVARRAGRSAGRGAGRRRGPRSPRACRPAHTRSGTAARSCNRSGRGRRRGSASSAVRVRSTPVGPNRASALDRLGLGAGEEPGGAHAVAADVPERPAAPGRVEPPVARRRSGTRTTSGPAAARRSPRRRPAGAARRSGGWCRHMNASISTTPRARQCSTIASASAASSARGFSQRTCLPASAAASVQGRCSSLGSGM